MKSKLLTGLFIATAISTLALSPSPDGGYPDNNTAEGDNALLNLTTGINNTAVGFSALSSDTTGNHNTAVGNFSLAGNNGENNSAFGSIALKSHTSGNSNTAIGASAMFNDQEGDSNTAIGVEALSGNTTGSSNVAVGVGTMRSNTSGSNNVALGQEAGVDLTTGNFNIDISHRGFNGENSTIRIGDQQYQSRTFIAGINGVDKSDGLPVYIDGNGQLGTSTAGSVPIGTILRISTSSSTPSGYTLIGKELVHYFDLSGHPHTLTVNLFQKN